MIWALLLALQAPAAVEAASYEGLVALGVEQARLGRRAEARATFERAIHLDPSRPEALVERSGLDFLEESYEAAADGLGRALALRDDAYARDLRASALQLAGRSEDALDEWTRLGQPRLADVRFTGLEKTRDRVARRELRFAEGDLLRADSFRETRLRLREVGVFPRVRLRSIPREDHRADVEVALTERHGLGSWQELAVSAVANALRRQVRLWYFNLDGEGDAPRE
jgi:tetratricopeptide (TPR) repeat protein